MKREQQRQHKIIDSWLQSNKVKRYVINEDFSVSVNGDVDLSFRKLIEFPSFIQFYIVNGTFDCSENQLTSLRGCPSIVEGNFYCYNNQLNSLDYCPEIVNGKFFCHGNNKTFDIREVTNRCDVNYINT